VIIPSGTLFLPARFLSLPIGELYESVRTGEPAFQRIFGQPFFEYLAAHPVERPDVGWQIPNLFEDAP
jgi:hypothetical protein